MVETFETIDRENSITSFKRSRVRVPIAFPFRIYADGKKDNTTIRETIISEGMTTSSKTISRGIQFARHLKFIVARVCNLHVAIVAENRLLLLMDVVEN